MRKSEIYSLLRRKVVQYKDLVDVDVKDCGEGLAAIRKTQMLSGLQTDQDMVDFTGKKVYVRQTVSRLLLLAAKSLRQVDGRLSLQVVYGYRANSVQKAMFSSALKQLNKKYAGDELYSEAHKLIAVPDVAGHPTGGAVDIRILKSGVPVYMGTEVDAFNSPDILVFSPFISKNAWRNRMLLRRVMMNVGFAPFDGEWWHFCYGDKEWAKYYAKPNAIYEQVEFSEISK